MEKKTLTSLAIITFLMSSTAVVAMGDDNTNPKGPPVKIETAEREDTPPSSAATIPTIKPATEQKSSSWFSWPWFSRSTPPVEEGSKEGAPATLPSTSTTDAPAGSSSSTTIVKTAIQLDTSLNMGEFSPYLSSGFSAFEGTHRWTAGDKAIIALPLEGMEPRPTSISFLNTGSFVTASHPQHLTIKVNGKKAGSYDYTHTSNNHRIDITLPKDDPLATIEFETLDAIIPSALGLNNPDKRKLGILFKEVQFQTPTPSAPTEHEFVTQSVHLDRDQLQRLLQLAQSADTEKLEEVGDIFSSPTPSTVSSETTPQILTTEERGLLSNLYHMIFG